MAELIDDVDSAGQLHPIRIELEILARAGALRLVGDVRAEGSRDASPLLVGQRLATEAAARDLRDLIAGNAVEAVDQPRNVESGVRGLDDEPGRVSRVPRAVQEHNRGAHRMPKDDRSRYPDCVTEDADVVRAGVEAPSRHIAPRRPPVPTQIEVDNLSMLHKRGEVGLEV